MKWKYKKGDWIVTTDNKVGIIKHLDSSRIDTEDIPSYWIQYSLSVYPDGYERNTWESSIDKRLPLLKVWWLIIKNKFNL